MSVARSAVLLMLMLSACPSKPNVCDRMASLCGAARADCEELIKSVGEDSARVISRCYAEAKSCEEAGACVIGDGALRALKEELNP